ncbi:hypothetical protein LJC27_05060 [Christensenellaceae bacterium OttesenSCG-928-M15]|nr:hypothetical protein [Christensenellaceae bacterium OttesenSCG-928-M15]
MKSLCLITLCFVLLFMATSCVSIGNTQPEVVDSEDPLAPFVEYLATHAVAMDALCEQELEYSHLSDYRVILMGETHGIQKTYDAELLMLQYLYEAYGVRHILVEYGYCDGMLVNEYLQTGDEEILKEMLKNLRGTAGFSNENYAFYTRLYEYNAGLASDRKIYISGVDVQHQFLTGIYYLSRLLPDVPPPDEIATHINALSSSAPYTNDMFHSLLESFETHAAFYILYLGETKYQEFNRGAMSVKQGIEYYAGGGQLFREKCLIFNCINALEGRPMEKAFGIFGIAHTALSATQQNGEPMLANYLNTHYKETTGKVASITCAYYNSKRRDENGVTTINADFPVISYAAPLMPDDISFCPLEFEGSPFAAESERSLDSQQYLAIIRNSDAVSIYKAQN